MKVLEERSLSWVNSVLSNCELGGDRLLLNGRIESFSCKMAKTDKKLAKTISQQQQQDQQQPNLTLESFSSSSVNSGSSVEMMDVSSSSPSSSSDRKLFLNLISTMNACFPDYDFSSVRPEQFVKQPNWREMMASINTQLAELADEDSNFLDQLWSAIHESIKPEECQLYSYLPLSVPQSDPFTEEGVLWSFNFFFYNKNMKKILYFTCMCQSKFNHSSDEDGEDDTPRNETMVDFEEYCGADIRDTLDWEDGV